MENGSKQYIIMEYILLKYPNISVGRMGRMLNNWRKITGN